MASMETSASLALDSPGHSSGEEQEVRSVSDAPSAAGIDMTGARIGFDPLVPSGDGPPRPPNGATKASKDAPTIELPNQTNYVRHIALDIGGSLIKLLYYTPRRAGGVDGSGDPGVDGTGEGGADERRAPPADGEDVEGGSVAGDGDGGRGTPSLESSSSGNGSGSRGGDLHFVKFQTSRVDDCIDFLLAKGLVTTADGRTRMRVKATGGGAYKFAERFQERCGLILEREDEMACLVDGANFLLTAIRHEAFRYNPSGALEFESVNPRELYPYLLVNIGSGVGMLRVDGPGEYSRVSGTNIGGGTFLGLTKLLTGAQDFDQVLEMSSRGDNSNVDMLVGDIYGGRDYTGIGLSANTIASSFGKCISGDKTLADYRPEDIAMSLCRMISYNIGQLAYLNALRYGLRRVFFGGFFTRGHPYTMETISFAIKFWSRGEMAASFLRHEGFLGAVGAFLRAPAPDSIAEAARDAVAGVVAGAAASRAGAGRGGRGGGGDGAGGVADAAGAAGGETAAGAGAAPGASPLAPPSAAPAAGLGSSAGGGPALGPRRPATLAETLGATVDPDAVEASRARFVERFHMGAPVTGGTIRGPVMGSISDKVSWVEKFIMASQPAGREAAREMGGTGVGAAASLDAAAAPSAPSAGAPATLAGAPGGAAAATAALVRRTASEPEASGGSVGGGFPLDPAQPVSPSARSVSTRIDLNLGVLSFTPSFEPFPLLADPSTYEASTFSIADDEAELRYWVDTLLAQIPTVVAKAVASCAPAGGAPGSSRVPPDAPAAEAARRAATFGRALEHHLSRLRAAPGAYGKLGLADLFELREECLREFGFRDVYRRDKARENAAALSALPDLLRELDATPPRARLEALVRGVLAANIFDWGAQACVDMYRDASILEVYRKAVADLAGRPWRVDDFRELERVWFRDDARGRDGGADGPPRPGGGGADDPSRPARAGEGGRAGVAVPASDRRLPFRRALLFVDNAGADVVLGMLPLARELLRGGTDVVLVANSLPAINDVTAAELRGVVARAAEADPTIRAARDAAVTAEAANGGRVPPVGALVGDPDCGVAGAGAAGRSRSRSRTRPGAPSDDLPAARGAAAGIAAPSGRLAPAAGPDDAAGGADAGSAAESPLAHRKGMFGESYPSQWPDPRLFIVASGSGSPCLDLRRISSDVADAARGADLVVIEGMGRALHTNYAAVLSCHALKLAMLKNAHLAKRICGGKVFDCVCRFDRAP